MANIENNDGGLRELALFAGAGGGILGGKLLGWRTVCAVEWDAYAASILVARQNDGCLPPFPIWDDVQTFDGRAWRGRVDVISGGFPCQDISCAGKGAGITGERSSMWKHMARIIGEVRPQYAFVENSPMLVGRGLETVLADLAEMGYDARWGIVGAHHAGAPHKRDRIWIVASIFHAHSQRLQRNERSWAKKKAREKAQSSGLFGWSSEPNIQRVAHGVAARVDRLKAIGNGQVPAVAALAWEILTADL
jgi:DNA (cytosine-5)-methyltransferase 1